MKLLVLGASPAQSPIIEAALADGHEVITADNLPDNPGHKLASKSFPVNAADAKACTDLARRLGVDGVVGYASEVCARTAARVAAELGLPGSPLPGVENLSNKAAFRRCQALTSCLVPESVVVAQENEMAQAVEFAQRHGNAVVVKPVDNSGGRGVSIQPADLTKAIMAAKAASWDGQVIVEQFIPRQGSQIGGDAWIEDGRIVFLHTFDNKTLPPPADAAAIQETFPANRTSQELAELKSALDACVTACGYTRGPINFDACFTADGRPLVFEIAPRNAGNRIPVIIRHRTGVDFPSLVCRFSLDPEFRFAAPPAPPFAAPFHAIRVLAAAQSGNFASVRLADTLRDHLLELNLAIEPGQAVRAFRHAGDALGLLLLHFPDRATMESVMANMDNLARIDLLP